MISKIMAGIYLLVLIFSGVMIYRIRKKGGVL